MIKLTRLNKTELYINPHQVEFLEETPDTIITMLSGKKILVTQSPEEVINSILEYRRSLCVPVVDHNDIVDSSGNEF